MPIKNIFAEVRAVKRDIENLTIEQLKSERGESPDLLLLDIREMQERVDLGTIPGALHAPGECSSSGPTRRASISGTGSGKTAGQCCSARPADAPRLR